MPTVAHLRDASMKLCELLLWIVVVAIATAGRFVGSWLGGRIGARHMVAWLGAFLGFSAGLLGSCFTMLALEYPEKPAADWFDELENGTFPASFIYGIIAAFAIEALAVVITWAIASSRPEATAIPTGWAFSSSSLLRSTLIVVLLGGIVYTHYHFSLAPWLKFRRASERILHAVDGLAQRRPKDVTRKQWGWVVGWTHNGVCNCLYLPGCLRDKERYYRFADELEERSRGEIGLSTIDWIWDEFEAISKGGRSYSERFRPTTPEHFREAGPHDFGIDVP